MAQHGIGPTVHMNLTRALPLLEAYAAREGHTRVPFAHTEQEFRLGAWVADARKSFRHGELDATSIATLESLPGWKWTRYSSRPNHGLEAESVRNLLAYIEAEHNLSDIGRDTTFRGTNLHRAISEIRGRYQRGELPRESIEVLDSIPGWVWFPRFVSFEKRVETLRDFHRSHGHLDVPTTQNAGYRSLSVWLRNQRYRYVEGRLDQKRITLLESLPGWDWCVPKALPAPPPKQRTGTNLRLSNKEVLELLRRFAAEYGHTRVPKHSVFEGVRLGQWVKIRRRYYRNGALNPDLARDLEELPGWTWDPVRDRTNNGIAAETAIKLIERYCAAGTPLYDVDNTTLFEGVRLYRIVRRLRRLRGEDRLTHEQIAALNELPGWAWTKVSQTFERHYALLHIYAREHGNARVPQDYVTNSIRLGRVVTRTRMLYHNGDLPPDHAARLELLPGWRWNLRSRGDEQADAA